MNICITLESAKNFKRLFKSLLPGILKPQMSIEDVVKNVFDATFVLLDDQGNSAKVRDVIIQHLGIAVVEAASLTQNMRELRNSKYYDGLIELQKVVESSLTSEGDIQKMFDTFGEMLSIRETVAKSFEDIRFNAVSLEFARTNDQVSMFSPVGGYKANITDGDKKYQQDATISILSDPSKEQRLKLVPSSEVLDDSKFKVLYELKPTEFVLVPVDASGEYQLFQNSIPVFKFRQNASEFTETIKAQVSTLTEFARINNQEYNAAKIEETVLDDMNRYLKLLSEAKSQVSSGKSVTFPVNYGSSNAGFVEFNCNKTTKSSEISNISSNDVVQEQGNYFLKNEFVKKPVRLFERSWLSLTEKEFEILHTMLTQPNATVVSESDTNKTWNTGPAVIANYLKTFIGKNLKISDTELLANGKVYSRKTLTIDQLKEIANDTSNDIPLPPAVVNRRKNVQILKSVVEVTESGQMYYSENGTVMQSERVRMNLLPESKASAKRKTIVDLVDGKLVVGSRDLTNAEYALNNSYVAVELNGQKELKGGFPYLAFTPEVVIDKFDNLVKFFSEETAAVKASPLENATALEWFENSPLSAAVRLVFSKEHSDKGPNFLASFIGDTITMYKGSPNVLLYHEAFHAFWNGVLSKNERSDINTQLRKLDGSFTATIEAVKQTIRFSESTDLQLEEFLAEEFRSFAQDKSTKAVEKVSKLKEFFQKILDALSKLFGRARYSELVTQGKLDGIVSALFKDLYSGNFSAANYSNEVNGNLKFASFENEYGKLSIQETNLVLEAMQSVTSLGIVNILSYHSTPEDVSKVMGIYHALLTTQDTKSEEYQNYNNALKSLNSGLPTGKGLNRLNSENEMIRMMHFVNLVLQNKLNVFEKELAAFPEDASLKFKVNTLKKALTPEVFGDRNEILNYQSEEEPSTLISLFLKESPVSSIIYPNEKNNVEIEEISNNEEVSVENEVFVLGADQYNNDVSEVATIDAKVMMLLKSIPAHTFQGKGAIELNSLGLPKLRSMSEMHFKLLTLLANSIDVMEMNAKLKKASQTDFEIRAFYNLIGDIENPESHDNLWNAVYKTFNKYYTPLETVVATKTINFIEERVDDYDEESAAPVQTLESETLEMSVGRIGQSRDSEIGNWKSNFNSILESDSPYVESDETGRKYLNLDYLITDYMHDSTKRFVTLTPVGFETSLVKVGIGGKQFSNNRVLRTTWDAFSFLKELGIEVVEDPNVLKAFLNGDQALGIEPAILDYFSKHLLNKVKAMKARGDVNVAIPNSNRIYKFDDLFNNFSYEDFGGLKQSNQGSFLKNLTKLNEAYSNKGGTFMSYAADGNMQNQMSYSSSLYTHLKILNAAQSYEELIARPEMQHYDISKNVQAEAIPFLRAMFNLTDPASPNYGKRNPMIKLEASLLAGSKLVEKTTVNGFVQDTRDTGVKAFQSDEITKYLSDIVLVMSNKQETPRAEAKSTSVALSGYFYKANGELRGGNQLPFAQKEAVALLSETSDSLMTDLFFDHLAFEMLRMTEVKRASEIEDLQFDAPFLNRANNFQFFDDILTESLKTKLLKLDIEAYSDLKVAFKNDSSLKADFEKDLRNFFLKKIQNLALNKGSINYPDPLLAMAKLNETDLANKEDLTNRLLTMFVINSTVNYLNYTSMFLGDFSNYNVVAEDFHKRIAGLISTGNGFRYDEAFIRSLGDKHYPMSGTNRKYTGSLKTGVIAEKKTDSEYYDYYKQYASVTSNDYLNMKEADGQGFISFDAYRILCKASDEWSDAQEELYQKIIAKEPLTYKDMASTTFPIRKFQYYGPVTGDNESLRLNLMAFHKYSLAPLVPGLIENTPLEKLHLKMIEQGVDYVTMESGSKIGNIMPVSFNGKEWEKNPDNFYNQDREVNSDIIFTANNIHVAYLKNQLYLAEGYKKKVTLPSQLRKIILTGLMSRGIPTDYSGTADQWKSLSYSEKLKESKNFNWKERYLTFMGKYTNYLRNEFLNDFSLVKNESTGLYEGDTEKLVNYIKTKLRDKELTEEEIESLVDPSTGELISDFSFSLHSAAIEKLLMTMIDKKLRRLKINGEALVQVSGAMQEQYGLDEVISKDGKLRYGSNQLKFYTLEDEFGNIIPLDSNISKAERIGEMEVMISLQGDYSQLFNLKHSDGSAILVRGNFNESLDRLNEMLLDEEFVKEHRSKLILPGVRIPTQSMNSLTIPIVKKFLPPHAGPVIILPSEIVAQAGSDFDIDKIYAMFKNIASYNGAVEEIKYAPTNSNISELKSERSSLQKGALREVSKMINDTYKELKNRFSEKEELKKASSKLYDEISTLSKLAQAATSESSYQFLQSQIEDLQNKMKSLFMDFYGVDFSMSKENRQDAWGAELESIYYQLELLKKDEAAISNRIAEINKEIDQNSVKGLQNEFMDLMAERLRMPDNFQQLVTPNTTVDAEGEARTIEKRKRRFGYNKYSKVNSKLSKISPTEIMMYEYNLYKQQENSVGMDSLGIAAVVSTYNAVFSTMDVSIQLNSEKTNDEFVKALKDIKVYSEAQDVFKRANVSNYKKAIETLNSYLPKNLMLNSIKDDQGNITFGSRLDANNKDVADSLSQLINGYVDVAKDAWVFLIEGNKENTPVLLAMLLMGVPLKDAVRISVHPLVREYSRLKKELAGPYSKLAQSESITDSSKIKEFAQEEIYNEHVPETMKSFNWTGINSSNDTPFTFEELDELSLEKDSYSERDLQLFAQYLHIEKISDEMTTLTSITKFDTQKLGTITDAEKRISDTNKYLATKIDNKFFNVATLTEIKDHSPMGYFNNDVLITNVFKKQFSLRNNEFLTKMSLRLKNLPKGVSADQVRSQYKNDFMNFLYQNSVYSGDNTSVVRRDGSIKNYKFVKHSKPEVIIDGETIYYNDVTSLLYELGRGGYNHVREFFMNPSLSAFNSQIKPFLSFYATYEGLVEDYLDLPIDEFKAELSVFDKQNEVLFNSYPEDVYRQLILQRAAMFYSRNPNSMFDSDMGVMSIINRLKELHPDIKSYSLINEMKSEISNVPKSILKKQNLFFPNISRDVELLKTYRENLRELSNHQAKAVRMVFNVNYFSHLGIMQTGLSRNVKNDIARIGNERHLQNELIQSGYDKLVKSSFVQIEQNYNEAMKKQLKEEAVEYMFLKQFHDTFQNMLTNKKYRSRYNGLNYVLSEVSLTKTLNVSSKNIDAKVLLVPATEAYYEAADFEENMEELIIEISNNPQSSNTFPNTRLVMSTPEKQYQLDTLLDQYLNLDNRGEVPFIIQRSSVVGIKEGLDISRALNIFRGDAIETKFSTVSKNSNKMIGISAPSLNPGYTTTISEFTKWAEEDPIISNNVNSSNYTEKDTVFIYGDYVVDKAYAGSDKKDYDQSLEKAFTESEPLLKAVAKAGSAVLVLNLDGNNKKVVEFFEGYGYSRRTVYSNGVKYYVLKPFENLKADEVGGITTINSSDPLGAILSILKFDDSFKSARAEIEKATNQFEKISLLRKAFNDYMLLQRGRSGLNAGQSYRSFISNEIARLEPNIETGYGKLNELYEQMLIKIKNDLMANKPDLSKDFNKKIASVVTKITTFEELPYSKAEKAQLISNLRKMYPEQYTSDEIVISSIEKRLKENYAVTMERLNTYIGKC